MEFTIPQTLQQNGVSKQINRTIIGKEEVSFVELNT